MPSHITVLPASTVAGKATIRLLLASEKNPFVRAIYRDPSKVPEEFTKHPRFEAVKGDVGAGSPFDFSGSDAIFYIPPPTFDGKDTAEFATQAANGVADAIRRAPSVKRLILHSAVGAHHDSGIGVLRLNHISDRILETAAPEVVIVKPCNYIENWTRALKAVQQGSSLESTFSPPDFKMPLVSILDVAEYCAKALLDESANKPSLKSAKIFGPRLYSTLDIQDAMEEVTGKKGELVIIPPEGLAEYFDKGMPEKYVSDFVELITAQLPGAILEREYGYGEDTVRGKVELVDGLRGIAAQWI
ncbi:uncharacterized protein DNG_09108 [Cephalotrichum gorgonifer]|uniref:NmrA-like domain-containing protein n=1 Tax=Cephalotrichum gorgonifer TaxID=2041049 RepID=A0AAE8SZ43_9PEZI|nr:uncharacterized protein DNG_09108 [Cephalotrichum gorgonifer]